MIAYLRGTVEYSEPENGLVILEAGGIGYNIYVPGSVFQYLPGRGEETILHTYLSVREDAMQLFGFQNRDDLKFFRLLLGVNGIGPKAAIAILSAFSADDLKFAILASDVKTLSKAPGVGKKTAERIILDLKDKLSLEEAFETKLSHELEAPKSQKGSSASVDDAVQALTALGYSSADALRVVRKIEGADQMDVEEILKAALKQMAFF